MSKIKPVGKSTTLGPKESEKKRFLKDTSNKVKKLVIDIFQKTKYPEPLNTHSAKIEKKDDLYKHIEQANKE